MQILIIIRGFILIIPILLCFILVCMAVKALSIDQNSFFDLKERQKHKNRNSVPEEFIKSFHTPQIIIIVFQQQKGL